jgi:ATP-dependent RNA helicase DeaD
LLRNVTRGIVDNITHVVNYQLPDEKKRTITVLVITGRAGKLGDINSNCNKSELRKISSIERIIKQNSKNNPIWN